MYTATYSPDDNKLRLYASSRLDAETYARVKAAGFKWAPKQDLFVAPAWSPSREDLLIELCGEIDDEDKSLVERAEERAERFDEYSDKRAHDAESARKAVSAIADNIPLGQPILIGHHSERHARKDAERIENGMRRAVKMWETSEYWKSRASGALHHAKYKELPAVRARRIKGLESDIRKLDKSDKEAEASLKLWALVDMPEKWKPQADGSVLTREERASYISGRVHSYVSQKNTTGSYWTAYDVLRLPVEERYSGVPVMTIDEVLADITASYARAKEYRNRWRAHYNNRLAYERAMLDEAGGIVTDQVKPEVGGAVKCLWSPRGGWAYIQKVNKVTVSILHKWNSDGRAFLHKEPFDKIHSIMSKAQVEQAREDGRIKEAPDGVGFWLMQSREEFDRDEAAMEAVKPEAPKDDTGDAFKAMREQVKAGVQIVTAPQLFPTPNDLAERMVALAEIKPGMRVLEPSAGTGRLLGAMGGRMFAHSPERGEVVAVEINQSLADRLKPEFPLTDVRCADFLQCNGDLGTFDRIIMNPPFVKASDIDHIQHAFNMLKPGGRLVAICANGPRQNAILRPMVEKHGGEWEDLPAGTFKEQGTGVNTALIVLNK